MASNTENISIWWHHHAFSADLRCLNTIQWTPNILRVWILDSHSTRPQLDNFNGHKLWHVSSEFMVYNSNGGLVGNRRQTNLWWTNLLAHISITQSQWVKTWIDMVGRYFQRIHLKIINCGWISAEQVTIHTPCEWWRYWSINTLRPRKWSSFSRLKMYEFDWKCMHFD